MNGTPSGSPSPTSRTRPGEAERRMDQTYTVSTSRPCACACCGFIGDTTATRRAYTREVFGWATGIATGRVATTGQAVGRDLDRRYGPFERHCPYLIAGTTALRAAFALRAAAASSPPRHLPTPAGWGFLPTPTPTRTLSPNRPAQPAYSRRHRNRRRSDNPPEERTRAVRSPSPTPQQIHWVPEWGR